MLKVNHSRLIHCPIPKNQKWWLWAFNGTWTRNSFSQALPSWLAQHRLSWALLSTSLFSLFLGSCIHAHYSPLHWYSSSVADSIVLSVTNYKYILCYGLNNSVPGGSLSQVSTQNKHIKWIQFFLLQRIYRPLIDLKWSGHFIPGPQKYREHGSTAPQQLCHDVDLIS